MMYIEIGYGVTPFLLSMGIFVFCSGLLCPIDLVCICLACLHGGTCIVQ